MIRVLFLCTANSARSILSEATLNHLGNGRFQAYSAGSRPSGRVHPQALQQLQASGMSTDGLSSKSLERYAGDDAPAFDIVITVCDSAAQDPCPVFFGDFVRSHWSLPDPAAITGPDTTIAAAFAATHRVIQDRIAALVALPVEQLDAAALANALAEIPQRCPGPNGP